MKFRPSSLLIKTVIAFGSVAIMIAIIRVANNMGLISSPELISISSYLWWSTFAALVIIAIIDASRRKYLNDIDGERTLPHYLALNRQFTAKFVVYNHSKVDAQVNFVDILPEQIDASTFPLSGELSSKKALTFEYAITPKQRGDAYFQPAQLLVTSQLGLWNFIKKVGAISEIKVYPDFSILNTTSLLSIEKSISYSGSHLTQKLGDGTEFQQLREFRIGDTLKQIDWKATSRLHKPISRQYQEEKDQNIIFMLDSSRRMRTKEANLSYFDHALNALLVNSYIALNKGDAVGVMTFSGQTHWLPPVKGKDNINQLLNHLYHIKTSTDNCDYIKAAETLLYKHQKRSLIILITNLHREDSEDILLASKLLSKRHLVMVVSLEEHTLVTNDSVSITDLDSALLYSGIHLFSEERKEMLMQLKSQGIIVVDANYQNMHIKLLHEYLQLKRIGRI